MMLLNRRLLHLNRRRVHSTPVQTGKIRDLIDKYTYSEADAKKRPSALEIKQKDLPLNTPTLEERIRRHRSAYFYELERKSGYYKDTDHREKLKDFTLGDGLFGGVKVIRENAGMYWDECVEGYTKYDWLPWPGDVRTEWRFGEDIDRELGQWITTCDSDWGEGYSECRLIESPSGKALFTGELSTRVPRDGRIRKSGYCNLSSAKRRKSWGRLKELNWNFYTDFVMRIRGDGRTYVMNVHAAGEYDVQWNDLWHYPLYTRGGPYWQYVRIPFGKFYLAHKGRVVLEQERVDMRKATGISFTLMDRIDGPFALEIDYIGVHLEDPNKVENLRWEEYRFPKPGYFQIM